jgi:acyl-CoA synthetase (AMP-forming)/AMP-acid ligase II
MNVGSLLTIPANKFPDRTALIYGNKRLTYRQFNQRSNQIANALLRFGLQKGDRVAALLFNSHELVEVFMGAAKVGMVFTPINFRLAAEEVIYLVNHSDARIFAFGEEFFSMVGNILPQLPKVEKFLSVGKAPFPQALEYEPLLFGSRDDEPAARFEEDECQMLYTSGPRASPKGRC